MILKGPTGAFERLLPVSNEDTRSVTYTISNQPLPPTINTFVVNAPTGILDSNPPVDVIDRGVLGQLIFTVVNGKSDIIGSNKKAFAPGDQIDFEEEVVTTVEDIPITNIVIQHNNNILDLKGLGLTDAEIEELKTTSNIRMAAVKEAVTLAQADLAANKILLSENQKNINEVTKAIKAVEIIYGVLTDNDIYVKLTDKKEELLEEKALLEKNLITLNEALRLAQNDLFNLSQVVK